MTVSVLFFGVSSDLAGRASAEMELKEQADVTSFKSQLFSEFPGMKNLSDFAVAVNEAYSNDSDSIKDGDEIAILPPVSGG